MGEGWLSQPVSPGVFLLLGITSLFDAAAGMLHVLALTAPIGTLFISKYFKRLLNKY